MKRTLQSSETKIFSFRVAAKAATKISKHYREIKFSEVILCRFFNQQINLISNNVMKIIPVIDIKDGIVVSAQQGQRHLYQPIKSKLCHSSSVNAVLESYLSIHPFKTIYLADLNAITYNDNNQSLIDKIVVEYPTIDFWVDNGKKIQNLPTIPSPFQSIIGSENQDYTEYRTPIPKNHILSLDFFPEQGYKGPKNLLENSLLWPDNIIIMTLNRVGNNIGPDFEKLACFSMKYPEKNFIAAGGVRNISDLLELKKTGIDHALIASALHSGMISTRDFSSMGFLRKTLSC